jgi:zinc protease
MPLSDLLSIFQKEGVHPMKRFLIPILIIGLAAVLTAAPPGKIFPFDYKTVTLPNGFKAYLIKAGASGQIAYVTVVRAGAREEWEPGKSGFAHFFEHIMFRGTEKYPNYDSITTRIGAARNASTSTDVTQYYLVAASSSLEQIVDLESDRFMNLKYTEPVFRTEAGAILGEFSQGRANPRQYLLEKLMDTAFDAHTYKHLTIGFEKDVRAMPEGYEYSISFHDRYYRPENCVLLLAGYFNVNQAEQLIRKYYSAWKPGYVKPQITPEPPQKASKEATVEFPGRTLPILVVAHKGPAWSATNRLAVAVEVLGQVAFGSNSDLYRRLVIKDQKVQSLSAGFGLSRDPGLLTIITTINKPEDVPAIKDEIRKTVDSFRTAPCDPKLLSAAKSAMKYGFLMQLETPLGINSALRQFVVFSGGIEALEDYFKTLESISAEDIQAAANRFLIESGRTTVTLLPAKGGA